MLEAKVRRKLESLTNIPTIPFVISQVLGAVDNENLSASALAGLIEKDQSLTIKVLSVANSPFYGFSRRISTIDLAIVILGLNTIKEIVLSLAIQKFFTNVRKDIFDVKSFWQYSVFCGAAGRVLARKLNYRLVGEAFVAGLMHDIGILILVQYFSTNFNEIRKKQLHHAMTFVEAEQKVMKCTHSDIGAWFANKWNLPENISKTIQYHHLAFSEAKFIEDRIKALKQKKTNPNEKIEDSDFDQPLTVIVALSEWFAKEMGFKKWALEENRISQLFLAEDLIADMQDHELLNPESAIELIKQEITDEFNKASVLNDMLTKSTSLYKK
jgi:HD-like signal output (HDOD) protein